MEAENKKIDEAINTVFDQRGAVDQTIQGLIRDVIMRTGGKSFTTRDIIKVIEILKPGVDVSRQVFSLVTTKLNKNGIIGKVGNVGPLIVYTLSR